jgi:hypothetical protein
MRRTSVLLPLRFPDHGEQAEPERVAHGRHLIQGEDPRPTERARELRLRDPSASGQQDLSPHPLFRFDRQEPRHSRPQRVPHGR